MPNIYVKIEGAEYFYSIPDRCHYIFIFENEKDRAACFLWISRKYPHGLPIKLYNHDDGSSLFAKCKERTKVIDLFQKMGFTIITTNFDLYPFKRQGQVQPTLSQQSSITTDEEIQDKRTFIHDTMIKKHGMVGNFTSLSSINLEQIMKLYDEIFFDNQISQKLSQKRSTINFQTTGGDTRIAGWCKTERSPNKTRCFFTMSFPAGMYLKLFKSGEKALSTNGLKCSDRLYCLQITFEHELIHMIMNLYDKQNLVQVGKGKQDYSSHGRLFQCMTKFYFGHTDFRHGLHFGDTSEHLTLKDIPIGTKIKVKDNSGLIIHGIVIKHNPKTIGIRETSPVPGREYKAGILNLKLEDDPSF